MLYAVLRGLARVALRWFYRDVTVVGGENIPAQGPLLLAMNHPNALVDALVAAAVVPRRVTLTAKATLWEHPVLRVLLRSVGIVPLRRAADERVQRREPPVAGEVRAPRRTRTASRARPTPRANDAIGGDALPVSVSFEATLAPGGAPQPPAPAAPAPSSPAPADAPTPECTTPLAESAPASAAPASAAPESAAPAEAPPADDTRPDGTSADGASADGGATRPTALGRNAAAFDAILRALEARGAVLIFPEGRSHSEPQLAPLKSGLARIALQARDERGVRDLRVLPVGLVFERKWLPRSRVLVQVGEPLALDQWHLPAGARAAEALTSEVDARLRAVTLNFATAAEEARTLAVSRTLAAAFEPSRPLGAAETPLVQAVAVARRVEAARERLAAGGTLPPRAAHFLERLAALRKLAASHRVLLEDAEIATGLVAGARFTVREGLLAAAALPVALWGAVNHYLPLHLAWWLGRRESRNQDDPAMRTIVAGVFLVLLFYAVQTGLVWWVVGPWWALLYAVTLPLAGIVQLRLRDRLYRAWRRARTYRLFRRDPALRARFAEELAWLRAEAVELEQQG